MGKAGEENPSCAFPSSQRCSHSVCVQGDRALLEARASSRGSPGQAVNPSFSQIFITRGIQLCKMPRILQNSKNAASLVSVKNVYHIAAEISMFPRNVLVIWVFSIREKVLLRDYWKSLRGGL